ncbi:hypothetical protein [Chryseobacterium sp. CT-SW4]|uniref:hypothetical protein n=1 Tax=Chryseobacterium sp. SW-1 TaxID=3157343 RepID=UPI003B027D8A
MKNNKLDSFELEDLNFSLEEFEKTYSINFSQEELNNILTFKDLSEVIINKFEYENVTDCTSQQAFYKVKNILQTINPKISSITPHTPLEDLIPRKNRRLTIKAVEAQIGFDLNLLRPRKVFISFLMALSLSTFILLFFNFWYAWILGAFSYSFYRVIFENSNEFKFKTVRELVENIMQEHYFLIRREPNTMNKEEFKKIVLNWFSDKMDMDKERMRMTRFV